MSDQIVRVVNDIKETDSQFMQSHQSVWMSRWKRTSCNPKAAHNVSPNTLRKMELDCTMGDDNCADKSKISRSVKTFGIMNRSLRKEGIEYQDLPMVPPANCGSGFLFKLGQVTDDVEISGCASGYNSNRVKAGTREAEIQFPGILASKDILFNKCKHRDEGTSKNPPKWTQSHSSAKDSTSAVSKFVWESFVKPSAVAGPFIFERQHSEFDDGKTLVPLFIGRSAIISSNQLIDYNPKLGEHEYQHNHKVDSHSQPRNSVTVCFMESNASSLSDPPSMSNHHLSALGREWFEKTHNFSGFRLFPSQFDTSEKTEVKKALYDCCSQQKVPKCLHDTETVRICSTVDSTVDPGGGCPRCCQATHSRLITNLENNASTSTRISGDTPCDLCNLSPFYGQGKRELKIQSPINSINGEGKGKYLQDSKVAAKNESSVGEKHPLSGSVSTPSKKVNNMYSTISQCQYNKVSAH